MGMAGRLSAVESFPLKVWLRLGRKQHTIPNHLTVKIDNAAIWGYHTYPVDLNQDSKPDYLLHQTYTTCGKYAGYGKILFFLIVHHTDTLKRKRKLSHFQWRMYSQRLKSFHSLNLLWSTFKTQENLRIFAFWNISKFGYQLFWCMTSLTSCFGTLSPTIDIIFSILY